MRGSGGRWGDGVVTVGVARVAGASAGWSMGRAAGARGGALCGVAGCSAARRVRVRGGVADGAMERSGVLGPGDARVWGGREPTDVDSRGWWAFAHPTLA